MNMFANIKPLSVNLGGDVLWVFFGVAVVVFSLMSLIYIYHWRTYSTDNKTIKLTEKIYLTVGFFLVAVSAFFITFFI